MSKIDYKKLSLYQAFLQGTKDNEKAACIISMNKSFN
jgi:hypothetical protein